MQTRHIRCSITDDQISLTTGKMVHNLVGGGQLGNVTLVNQSTAVMIVLRSRPEPV